MIKRQEYLDKINNGFKYNPIVVLLGARQVGKTTLMKLYSQNNPAFWLIGENPETAQLFEKLSVIERFLKLNMNNELQGLLVIDEFQYIKGISIMLKLLADKYADLSILCSGSSSLDIMQEVEESLAGRVRIISVYSLSFAEYVKFYDDNLYAKFTDLNLNDNIPLFLPEIQLLLNEYLIYGGLPKIAKATKANDKEELLNDIFQTYLLKDVRQYVRNQDFVSFNKLLKILSSQIGNMLNINELSNTLQLSYKACEEYIYILEQMFIIHLVDPFTTNKRHEITKMKKIYFCDLGLRNIIYNSFNDIDIRVDNGQLFENYAYLELIKYIGNIHVNYYRTKDKTEIDFILTDRKGNCIPVEVKYKNFEKPKKIRALTEFAKNNENNISYIINRNNQETIGNQKYVQAFFVSQIV